MNKKALLLAVFAATFFGATTFTFASEVTIAAIEENQETTNQKPIATIKKVIDQEILSYCKENDLPLCQQFLAYAMAFTDSIDLDADAATIFDTIQNDLREELNNPNKNPNVLMEIAVFNEKAVVDVAKALQQ